jgi:hypothetical protein
LTTGVVSLLGFFPLGDIHSVHNCLWNLLVTHRSACMSFTTKAESAFVHATTDCVDPVPDAVCRQ